MTDLITLIQNLAPLVVLVALPIAAIWALDAPDVHVPESRTALPIVREEDPAPAWRLDRVTPPARGRRDERIAAPRSGAQLGRAWR